MVSSLDTKTHTIFIGEMIAGETQKQDSPMTYAYYHNVVKGKSPKNAPTYMPEESMKAKPAGFQCKVCGYKYEGETSPETFRCPICGQEVSVFEAIT